MRGIIINEKEVLEDFFSGNKESKLDYKISDAVKILIKKYYLEGKQKDDIYQCIMCDLEKYLKRDFIYTNWNTTVKGQINTFYKNLSFYKTNVEVCSIENLYITGNELNKIHKLDNLVLEKIAFVILVYGKLTSMQIKTDECWINKTPSVICKEARVGLKGDEKVKILHKLYTNEYISVSKINNKTNLKVCFIDKDINLNEYDEGIWIDDFSGVVYFYLNWKGQNWIKCKNEDCSKWVRVKSNSQKYCNKCQREKQLEWQRQSMKKLRNTKNVK